MALGFLVIHFDQLVQLVLCHPAILVGQIVQEIHWHQGSRVCRLNLVVLEYHQSLELQGFQVSQVTLADPKVL